MSNQVREEAMFSSIKTYDYAYTWVIGDFRAWLARAEQEQSSFPFPSDETAEASRGIQWILSFRWASVKDKQYCSLFLELASPPETDDKFEAKFEITLADCNDRTIERESMTRDCGWRKGWGWHNLIKRATLLKKVGPGDKLFIKCKVTVNAGIVNESLKGNYKHLPEVLPSTLSRDLHSLADSDKFGDVTFVIDGERFRAYKGILAARSTVFAAMFEHPMQETVNHTVSISDMKPQVFKELLRYIYSDELSTLQSLNVNAHELYTAADKYAIPTLKSLCRHYILKKLNWETAAETLVLAEMHRDREMKKHALQFLSGSDAGKVTKTWGWKQMVRSHPYLVDETSKALTGAVKTEAKN